MPQITRNEKLIKNFVSKMNPQKDWAILKLSKNTNLDDLENSINQVSEDLTGIKRRTRYMFKNEHDAVVSISISPEIFIITILAPHNVCEYIGSQWQPNEVHNITPDKYEESVRDLVSLSTEDHDFGEKSHLLKGKRRLMTWGAFYEKKQQDDKI